MPTTNHTITVTIDGKDRSASLLYDALSVRAGIGNTGNVADLQITEADGYEPQAWDEVLVAVNGVRIFGGYVATRAASGLSTGDGRVLQWALTCRDWSMLLDRLVITNEQFFNVTDANVVRTLFENYLEAEGFDLSQVQTTRYELEIGFQRVTLRQALDKLAQQVGAGWYIDALKRLYWYNRWAPPRAAFNIDTAAPDGVRTFDVLAGSLERSIDDSKAINRVEVFGKDVQGELRTQTFAAGADLDYGLVSLDYRVHSVQSVTAEFAGYGVTTLTGNSIGYEPEAILWSPTGSGAELARMRYVVVNREQQTVKFRSPAGAPVAGTMGTVRFYELTPVHVVVDDADLQRLHERVLTQQVFDEGIATAEKATDYANYLLSVYGRGAESVRFEVAEFGLLPGTEIDVFSPTLKLGPTITQAGVKLQGGGYLLLEDGGELLLQSLGEATVAYLLVEDGGDLLLEDGGRLRTELALSRFLVVQEVAYRPVRTPTGWMMIAGVTAGEREQTLIDIMAGLTGGAGVAGLPAAQLYGRVSDVASDLGEVVAGRALFTDGGTAPFAWGTANGHSGVVVGLDDTGGTPRGVLEIFDAGVRRLRLGHLAGLPAVGTVDPGGWGVWTDNGFFQGQVAASTIYGSNISGGTITGVQVTGNYINGGTVSGALVTGGTVAGGLVTGGTVSGALVSGGTVAGALVFGGTVRTSAAPVNTGNPGVMMDAGGLVGFGTLGMTFKIPTDPADRPLFSSGTILNTVYEVTTASVLRTGTAGARVQMDNSGIFAWNSSNVLKFAVDAASGLLSASDGIFSGSVNASTITGGTVTGARISGGTVTGALVSGGTVSGGTVTGATITGGNTSGGTISAARFSGGTVTGALVSGNTVQAGTVSGATISGNTISGNSISGGTVTGARISGGTVTGALVSGAQITGGTATFGQANGTAVIDNRGVVYTIGVQDWPFGVQFVDAGWTGGGVDATRLGTLHQVRVHSDGASDLVILQAGNGWPLVMGTAGLVSFDWRPADNGGLNLGDSTRAWKYLYLLDSDGSVRRLECQFGALVIT